MNLPEKLACLRKQKGLTQASLAETLNVSRQAISRWEVGTAVPSTDNLLSLSALYGVSVDYLLNDETDDTCQDSAEQNLCQEDAGQKTAVKSRDIWVCSLIAAIAIFIAVVSVLTGAWREQEPADVVPIEEMDTIAEDNYSAETFLLE